MSEAYDRLVAVVAKNASAADSLIAAFKGQAQLVRDAAGDRVKTLAVADEIEAKAEKMIAAVTEGTDIPPLVPV